MVERIPVKDKVVGSNPTTGAKRWWGDRLQACPVVNAKRFTIGVRLPRSENEVFYYWGIQPAELGYEGNRR